MLQSVQRFLLVLVVVLSGAAFQACSDDPNFATAPDDFAAPPPAPAPAAPPPVALPSPPPTNMSPTSPTPSPGPTTPDGTVGNYSKRGTRNAGSNCNPPVLGDSFDGRLNVTASTVGNLGVLFTQTVGDVTLNYSQLTASTVDGRVRLVSGAPIRSINRVDYTTQIDVTFTGSGFTGTETFIRVTPPCTDTYSITGTK